MYKILRAFFMLALLVAVSIFSACNTTSYQNVPEEYHPKLDYALSQAGDNKDELRKAL